jgi:hypothetical protein
MSEISSRGGGPLVLDAPGGVQHHQPRGVDLGPALGDPLLHHLLRAERHARGQLAVAAWRHSRSNARSQTPIQRMQW